MNFSVIVSSYNRAARLRRALVPILEQTSVSRENSVVDDSPGSATRCRRSSARETRDRDSDQRCASGTKTRPGSVAGRAATACDYSRRREETRASCRVRPYQCDRPYAH